MTIRDALRGRIRYVRLPHWLPGSWIELPLLENDLYGPWATVHDPVTDEQLGMWVLMNDPDDRYEACEGVAFKWGQTKNQKSTRSVSENNPKPPQSE